MPISNRPSSPPTVLSINAASADNSSFPAQVNDVILIICISFASVIIALLLALLVHLVSQRRYKSVEDVAISMKSPNGKKPVIKSWTKRSNGTFSIMISNIREPKCLDDSLLLKMSYKLNQRGDLTGSIAMSEKKNEPNILRGCDDLDTIEELEDTYISANEDTQVYDSSK